MRFYLSVGPSAGSVQFYPGTSAFQVGSASTLLLHTINVQAVPIGTTLYINLWYETPKIASEPSGAREWRFISETKKITTGPTSITPVGNTLATLLPPSGANREPQNFTWNAGSGPDQKEYWLTVGTTVGATNLYNSYNSAVPDLSHSLSAREYATHAGCAVDDSLSREETCFCLCFRLHRDRLNSRHFRCGSHA